MQITRVDKSPERYHGLDLLRALAMLLGLLIHAPLLYTDPAAAKGAGLAPVAHEEVANWIFVTTAWIHQWRMPVFFILAGFFGCMVIAKRGPKAYLYDRLIRLGLALLAFGSLYNLLMPSPGFELYHLWFLYYLFLIAAATASIAWMSQRLSFLKDLALALSWPAKRLSTMTLYLAPLVLITPFVRSNGWAIIPEKINELHPTSLAYYFFWFSIGMAMFWRREIILHIRSWRLVIGSLIVGLSCTPLMIGVQFFGYSAAGGLIPSALLSASSAAAWSLFFIGLCSRIMRGPSTVLNWLVTLSYPVYIFHMYPAIVLGIIFLALDIPAEQAFWPIVFATFCISVIIYYSLIKYTPLEWLISGPRKSWFRPHWLMIKAPS